MIHLSHYEGKYRVEIGEKFIELDIEGLDTIGLTPAAAKSLGEMLVKKANTYDFLNVIGEAGEIPEHVSKMARTQLEDGHRIGAVKTIREWSGIGIKEAIYYVDHLL